MPKLNVKNGEQVSEVALTKDNFRIGRTAENDLEINSALVSRRQSSIVRKGDRFIVYDLDSSNGTYVNGERVEMKVLDDGDVIRVGEAELTFVDPRKPPGTERNTKVATGVRPDSAAEIVQHVEDIAESYAFDITDALSKGLSLRDIRKEVQGEKAAKESKMFFILFQVGKQLANAATLDEMLSTSMKLIFEVINCERGAILLLEPRNNTLYQRLAYHRAKGEISNELGVSHTITSRVLTEKVATITSDAMQDPRFMQGMSIVQYNIRGALCVPLWESDRSYGVIYLDNLAKSYAFTRDDLELLTAIANLVAIRIKQDELHEKLKREEILRTNLSKYHSPDVVEHLMKRGGDVGLEIAEREVTVLCVDIESSTRLAERMGATQVATLLNMFFEMATNAVFTYKGHVNKFIGDAVMAIFNAPLDVPDHALCAVQSAVKMIKDILRHNSQFPQRCFNIRVGVNSGIAVAGNVGTPNRLEYTVLGDTVNVAFRLGAFPQVNKVIVGETTYALVKSQFKAKDLGEVILKGKEKPTRAYEIEIS